MVKTPHECMGGRQGDNPTPGITTLKRREIQSPLFVSLMRGYIGEVGYEKAMAAARSVIEKDAMLSGRTISEKFKGNSLKEMARILKEVWAEEDALEYTILEQTDQRFSFDVTRCRYVELYEKLGIKEFGWVLSCSRDAPFIKGFNPRMSLFRTQTIMQGASRCDFRIQLD